MEQRHGDGVRLFSGRAARAPNADFPRALPGVCLSSPLRKDLTLQVLEMERFAEKLRFVGRDAIDHADVLGRIGEHALVIFAEASQPQLTQAAGEPPHQQSLLDRGQIDASFFFNEPLEQDEIRVGDQL